MEKVETQKWQPMIRDNKCNGVVSCAGHIQRPPLEQSLKICFKSTNMCQSPKKSTSSSFVHLWGPLGIFVDLMGSLRTTWNLWGSQMKSSLCKSALFAFPWRVLLLCRFVEAWGPPFAPSVPVAPNLAHFGWFCQKFVHDFRANLIKYSICHLNRNLSE